jgi:DNA-binding NtrC family response regulator
MPYSGNILVIDDEESMRAGCVQSLTREGYRVQAAKDGYLGLEMVKRESFDVIILDLKMPGIPGMDVLRKIRESNPNAVVLVITGYGTIDIAVEAMRLGASNFLTKPFTPEALGAMVNEAMVGRRRTLEDSCIDSRLGIDMGSDTIIGRSPEIREVIQFIQKVAPNDSTVLIYGETGVGKELVARTIHRLSGRCDRPFVTVDCGTLVESLFESEMFGHVKGSFTGAIDTTKGKFELANGGTIFLDEISSISIKMQARLLRAIQEREISKVGSQKKISVDVRIAAATNKNLHNEMKQGRFREDLYYRLNVVPVRIPPLRERKEDIRLLSSYFIEKFSQQRNCAPLKFMDEAVQFLESYEWPGNVRELKNVIERAFVTSDGKRIRLDNLIYNDMLLGSSPLPESGSLSEMEKKEITKVLDRFNGHKAKAADYLGINRKTLREKMRKYGIEG